MKLYHFQFSSNARKALMTAYQLGLSVELVNVDLSKGEQRRPEFLALNPNGKVPVLVDDDFVLFESQAIMSYFAGKTPGQKIYPTDLRARADVDKWMFWSANHFGTAIATLNWERVVKKFLGHGAPDAAQVERGEAMFHTFAKVLDAHLAKRQWVSGSELTLADIAIACPLMVEVPAALPTADYPNLRQWFLRVQELDSWKKSGG
ncbi:MAG TPA: glutathione S-transferase family protein [Labilithrix sp.]|jgi:glutathione S-transferase|nr:glutathione S-transferase family protein [Labilithrix sp.]